jgi:ABC-type polysaccharide/polyol phosphate transport system ATPase subunit
MTAITQEIQAGIREEAAQYQAVEAVIIAENVTKQYVRAEARASLRHEALNLVRRALRQPPELHAQPFNALQNVTFTINRGESVAVIGRNGSGKTTLLRILSGILKPSSGRVEVRGRSSALIGLSAGFLPEMTGRKNIYLNAALFGVPPRQIDPILDDIIDFAEIRPFIDTPVKNYSSGMVSRLGFSVAVHILPDIVFIDEALSVGDAAFQEKCVDRMARLKAEGRTLLFVSHDLSRIPGLCERTLWLHKGRLRMDGPTPIVLEEYEDLMKRIAAEGRGE